MPMLLLRHLQQYPNSDKPTRVTWRFAVAAFVLSGARIVRLNFCHFHLSGGALLRSLLTLVFLGISVSQTAFAQANAGANAATRYVEALQKGDFKTVIDLSYAYQTEMSQLKAQN